MAAVLAALVVAAAADLAYAQTTPPPAVQPFVRNWTRLEIWRYFEPPPGGGDAKTAHVGNRLQAGVRLRRGVVDATVALQYVQFAGLPDDAFGPGALGTGALYFDHSGDRESRQLFLKAANLALRRLPGGFEVQIGRMPYASGGERASGVPRIETVKRQRLDARLVGEFEWSLFQRAFDGIRVDWVSPSWQATAALFRPTQGGFEDAAGVGIDDIELLSAAVTSAPGAAVPGSELQVFAQHYRDDRRVTARPDNTGRRATQVDVRVTTVGGHLVSARSAGPGEWDALFWGAAQLGSWYELDHRALGVSAEGGYQWSAAPWTPWVRAGYLLATGDGDPNDESHGTFFPMLPTARRYAQSTLYTLANLRDAFVQLIVRPRAAIAVRTDLHLVSLDSAADGWYSGSGATQEEGRIFGYSLRPSNGARRLMDVLEASIDWRLTPQWSVNAYVAVASRGRVVRGTFAGGPATCFYLEHAVQF